MKALTVLIDSWIQICDKSLILLFILDIEQTSKRQKVEGFSNARIESETNDLNEVSIVISPSSESIGKKVIYYIVY